MEGNRWVVITVVIGTNTLDCRTLLVGNAIGQLFDVDLRRAIKDEKVTSS